MCQGQALLWGSTCVATVGAVWWGFKKFYKKQTTVAASAATEAAAVRPTHNLVGALAVPAERAVLPIHVDPSRLPCGVAIAPVLLYPPRHALVPFIADESIPANGVTQVLLCCEDIARLAAGQTQAAAPATVLGFHRCEAMATEALTDAFLAYVDTACPFFHSASSKDGNGVKTKPQCMPLQDMISAFSMMAPAVNSSSLFTHVVAGQQYCALLAYLPEASSIVTLVFVADVKGALDRAASILSTQSCWGALVSAITANTAEAQECSARGFGKGRLRATGRVAKPARLVTATISGCPHVHGIETAASTCGGGGPVLSVVDGVDGSVHTTVLEAPPSLAEVADSTCNGSGAQAAGSAVGSSEGNAASSRLEASLLEAWEVVGDASSTGNPSTDADSPMSCLLQYTNDVLGISLQCTPGCSLDEVRYAPRPCVRYMPQPLSSLGTRPPPLLTVERVTVLPEGWEQASASFTADAFLELLQHNIVFNLTPWESRGKRPQLVETDICGRRSWMLHEETEGQRCRTYVCPHLAAVPGAAATTATKGQSPVGPLRASLVKELLLIRWEVPVEDWDTALSLLRRLLDTLHIDFGG